MKKNKRIIRQICGSMAPFSCRAGHAPRNQIANQSKPMKTQFESTYKSQVAKLTATLGTALVKAIQDNLNETETAISESFDKESQIALYPHETLSTSEQIDLVQQFAQDAVSEALKALSSSYVQSAILKTAIA